MNARPERSALGALTEAIAPGLCFLEALLENGAVTLAAKACGVSQPTLTRAMVRWEAAAGTALFDRSRRTIAFTPQGLTLALAAKSAIDELRCALSVKGPTREHPLVVGSLRSLGRVIVPELVASYLNDYGPISVRLVEGASDDVSAGVRTGNLDLGVTAKPADLTHFAWCPLGRQSMSLVVSLGHAYATRSVLDLRDFNSSSFVALDARFDARRRADALCAEAGFEPNVVLASDDAARLRHYVADGLGVAILPTDLSINPRVRYVRIASQLAVRQFGLLTDARRGLGPAVAGFIEHTQALEAKYPGWADLLDS